MNLKTAEQLLPCYRDDAQVASRVTKAARVAAGDATLREKLEAQKQWDSRLVAVIHSIAPPEDFRKKLISYGAPSPGDEKGHSQLRRAGMLAVFLGLLVFVGLIVMHEMDRREQFQGKEAVVRMIEVTRNVPATELEPAHGEASELGDWFYMRGFEGFVLPADIAKLSAVGSRVFRQNGMPVAQIFVDQHNLIVFVFRPADFAVDLPEANAWRVFEHEGWAAAIRRQGGSCAMLSFRGTRAEMREFLRTLEAK